VPPSLRALALERRWPDREWHALELDYDSGCPVVELDLGGGVTASLIVDTGAAVTSLPREALQRVESSVVGSATVSGRIGGARTSQLHLLEAVRIAGWDVALATPELEGELGLLGMDVLGLFPVAIDGPGQKLWIGAPLAGEATRAETTGYQISQFGSQAQ